MSGTWLSAPTGSAEELKVSFIDASVDFARRPGPSFATLRNVFLRARSPRSPSSFPD